MDLKHALNVYEHNVGKVQKDVHDFVRFVRISNSNLKGGQKDMLHALMELFTKIEGTQIGNYPIGDYGGNGDYTTLCDFIMLTLKFSKYQDEAYLQADIDATIFSLEETIRDEDEDENAKKEAKGIVEDLKIIKELPVKLHVPLICNEVKMFILDHDTIPYIQESISDKKLRVKSMRRGLVINSSIMFPKQWPDQEEEQADILRIQQLDAELIELNLRLDSLYKARLGYEARIALSKGQNINAYLPTYLQADEHKRKRKLQEVKSTTGNDEKNNADTHESSSNEERTKKRGRGRNSSPNEQDESTNAP